jgi:hypothetical protein
MSTASYALYIEYNLGISDRVKFRGFYHLTQYSQVGTKIQCQEMKNRLEAGQHNYLSLEIIKLPETITLSELEKSYK